MEIENSVSVKSRVKYSLKEQINDYLTSLHNVSEASKHHYASCFGTFVDYLEKKGIKSFKEVTKTDIGQFLSTKQTRNTKNLYIFIIKSFYKNYLGKDKLVEQLHQKPSEETLLLAKYLRDEREERVLRNPRLKYSAKKVKKKELNLVSSIVAVT